MEGEFGQYFTILEVNDLPRVGIVWDVGAAAPFEILRAAAGRCEVCFIVDSRQPAAVALRELLQELADTVVVDVQDLDAAARALCGRGLRGITTYSELALEVTAALAACCGLPFHDDRTLTAVTRKDVQRRLLQEAGIPTPGYARVTSAAVAAGEVPAIAFPAVLKPVRGAGSRDTWLVSSEAELRQALQQVRGPDEEMILEELLVGDPAVAGPDWGDFVSVEGVGDGVRNISVAVSGKLPMVPPFRETGTLFPSTLRDEPLRAVMEAAEAAANAVGAVRGVTHTEVKLTADGPRIIEVNGRLGGYVADPIQRASGFDLTAAVLDLALGRTVAVPELQPTCVAFQTFVAPPWSARTFTEFACPPAEVPARVAGIQQVQAAARPGQAIDVHSGTQSYVARIWGAAPAHDEALRTMREAWETLGPRYAFE